MNYITLRRIVAAVVAASISFATIAPAAYADEWKNVPHALYFRNGQTVTPDMIKEERGPVLDHCLFVAYKTIPGKARTILGKAFTSGLAGGVGEGGGTAAEAAVLGERLVKNAIPAVGLLGFLSNVFFGGFQGDAEVNSLFRGQTDACLARWAGGLYTMDPDEADQILASGIPHVVGLSKYWGAPRAAGQPFVPLIPPVQTTPPPMQQQLVPEGAIEPPQ